MWSDQLDKWHYQSSYTETRYRAGSAPDSFTTQSSGEAGGLFSFQEVSAYAPHTEADGSRWLGEGGVHRHESRRADGTLVSISDGKWLGCIPWTQ